MSRRAELMKLQSYDLPNEDLCDTADIEVDGERIIGVNDDLITIEVSHPKFNTDVHPLVVGLQYKGWSTALHCRNFRKRGLIRIKVFLQLFSQKNKSKYII